MLLFKRLSKWFGRKREPGRVTYERVSRNEVKIIYQEGDIHNEVIALVATKGTY